MTDKPESDNSTCLSATPQAFLPRVVSIRILLTSFSLLWFCAVLCPVARAENPKNKDDIYSEKLLQSEQCLKEFKKGKQFFEDGSYELARKQMLLALRLDNEHLEARYYMGLIEKRRGKHTLAIEHFMYIYKKKPHFRKLAFETASSHLALGNCAEARTWLDRYLKTEPVSKDTRNLRKKIKECLKGEEKQGGQQ